jgi:hypothetical protein
MMALRATDPSIINASSVYFSIRRAASSFDISVISSIKSASLAAEDPAHFSAEKSHLTFSTSRLLT